MMPIRLTPLLTLSFLTASVAAVPGLIDNAPAPPPDEGPPLSAHASRDRSLLPAQICGIVGAYILTVLAFGILLLTIGRRLRRQNEGALSPMDIEMVKQTHHVFDPSPVSPISASRQWFACKLKKSTSSLRTGATRHGSQPTSPVDYGSPGGLSISSFDQAVLELDKEQRQREMERLYAAVMEEDAKRNRAKVIDEADEHEHSRPESSGKERPILPKKKSFDRRPGNIMTTTGMGARLEPASDSMYAASPRSPVRAIYPPSSPLAPPRHQPPYHAALPSAPSSPVKAPTSPRSLLTKHSRNPSFGSSSGGKKSRRSGVRGLRISAPLRYPAADQGDDDEEARVPLSPRFYNPPPPPSPPSQATSPVHHSAGRSGADTNDPYAYENLDEPRPLPLPRPAPHRTAPASLTINTGHVPAGTSSPAPASNGPATSSTLPFRALSQQQHQHIPASPTTNLKTTYVERRADLLQGGTTPRTGVPRTPYSPYMPFTPVTPVTPGFLVGRKERKALEREERRRRRREGGGGREVELVRSQEELWEGGL